MEEWIAKKQAEQMGIYGDERHTGDQKVLALIDAKGGDYYNAELHPNPGAFDALDKYLFGGHNNPLAHEVIADMRNYYGVPGKTAAPVEQLVAAVPVTGGEFLASKKGLDVTTMPQELQDQLMSVAGALDPKPVIAAVRQVSSQVAPAVAKVKAAPEAVADKVVEVVSTPAVRKAGEAVAKADDVIQTAVRQKVYGERPDGSYPEGNMAGAKALLAHILHGSGPMLQGTDDLEKVLYLAGTRGLQAGAITGAGAGLASLISDNEAEKGQIIIR